MSDIVSIICLTVFSVSLFITIVKIKCKGFEEENNTSCPSDQEIEVRLIREFSERLCSQLQDTVIILAELLKEKLEEF